VVQILEPAAAGAGAAPAAAPTPAPQRELLRVGERLAFQGRWMGLPVGYGWIEVTEMTTVQGRPAYHIEAHGRSNNVISSFYPIHDVIHSYLDAETLKPLRFEKKQREGGYRSDEVVEFDHAKRNAHYRSLLNGSEKDVPLPEEFQDLISALYWFRSQPLEPGKTITVNFYTDEKIYETEIEVKERVLLELLKRGTFECFLVEPKARFKGLLVKRGRIWAYLTADQRRLPLLVKATTPWGQMSAILDASSIPVDAGRRPAGS
jgi:hypothetical protein